MSNIQILNQDFFIWKLFTYATEEQRYLQRGTLHSIQQTMDKEGMTTTILSANDAYIDIPEFDIEYISFGDYHEYIIPSVESVDVNSNKILEYKPVRYEWLETMGSDFDVDQVIQRTTIINRKMIFDIKLK